MSNKKSQLEDWLPLLGVCVVLLMVLAYISFFNIKIGRESRARIDSQVIVKDSAQTLLNYLNSPLSSRYPRINLAEGISLYTIDKSPEMLNQINIATENFFSKSILETDYSTWSIEIKHNDEQMIIEPQRAKSQHILRKEVAKTVVPTHYGSLVEVNLFIITTRFVSG